MGQRLIVSIENNGKEIANIYFHWDAYTDTALYRTKEIVDCIYSQQGKSEKEMLLHLIHFCENRGGGITGGCGSVDWEHIKKLYPNESFKGGSISRNDGLISLSEEGMAASHKWSEGDVIINLDEEIINFGVYSGYESFDEFKSERLEWDEDFSYECIEEIPDIGCDLGFIKISDIGKVYEALGHIHDGFCRYGNEIFELTE